jgi:YggT family protein
LLYGLDTLVALLRVTFIAGAALAGVLCMVDWLGRSRRLSPFSPLARFARNTLAPLLRPIEVRVIRAGGNPVNAPWWAFGAVLVIGIVVLSLVDFLRAQTTGAILAARAGPRGVVRLVVHWGFSLLYLAIIVRVIASWFVTLRFSPFARWAFVLTEPMLRPLRRVLPTFAMLDISPLVAWLLLRILEIAILSAL